MRLSPRAARIVCSLFAAILVCTVVQPLRGSAGTTGGLTGAVTDAEGRAPVAGAKVTASSPSETATTTTDAGGHFVFVSLAPDEYTISVQKDGYDTTSISGIAVFADATQVVPISVRKSLKTIANVTARAASSLVRPGTTSDVYSVNAAQQARANVLGGGGNLTSAYSAIATVPGAYVPSNQAGYNQAVHVRGGDSSEVGYEFDGIPVNRGFDNYPGGGASSLGQLELQVYTGATPANGEAQGLAGFINQVIKTGTYPGYASASASLGAPTFYHELSVETGGSSPDRLFSYYAGVGGYNQEHRYVDQFDGASVSNEFGPILDQCQSALTPTSPPSCFTNGAANFSQAGAPGYILGPIPYGNEVSAIWGRTVVTNFHLGIPHKHDSLRDDIQLLYDSDTIYTPYYVSAFDEGLNNFQGQFFYPQGTLPFYQDSWQYNGALGTTLDPAAASSQIVPYLFPSSPTNRINNGLAFFAPTFPSNSQLALIPLNNRDLQYNNQNIVKLQYQKNFSSDSFLRLYGYTYYSNYIGTGPVSSFQPVTGFDSGDYELNSHTRGISLMYAKQFSSQHLVQAQASYTTSTSLRMNNTQMYGNCAGCQSDGFAVLVNPNDLTSGTCYALPSAGTVASATTCGTGNVIGVGTPATFASLGNTVQNANGSVTGVPGGVAGTGGEDLSNPGNFTCGTSRCALYTVENGRAGKYNTVTPVFSGFSITDEYRPNDKLLFNVGLRLDNYKFEGDNTTGTAARTFWFNAFNHDTCFNTQNLTLYDKTALADGSSIPISSACPAGYVAANLQNVPNQTFIYNVWQPRIGVTYTVSPYTVLRASYGRYNEQPSAAYVQYDALQQNLPDQLAVFYPYGFTTPGHAVAPSISYNSDFSIEHQFKGTDMSLKFTPFLRQTQNQIENFYLNVKQGFISGLNAGNQTSEGFEFAFNKGDFNRNGFAAQLAFTYTYAYVRYNQLSNGTTILSPINADIRTYNAYTQFCANNPTDGRCGTTTSGVAAAPCYDNSGLPVSQATCATAAPGTFIANPYWNAPAQALLDPNGKYVPYSTIPAAAVGTGVNSYNYPYNATLILNYKHDKWAITPSFQYVAGNRYGAPETWPGIDPAAGGCAALAGTTTGDPRYPYGATAGSPYDATTCLGQLNAIPEPYTGQFDGLGAFRQPAQFLMHLRFSYDFTPRVAATVTLANLISTCYGGQNTPFTYYYSKTTCSYTGLSAGFPPVGNVYNPGDNVQTFLKYPYEPSFGTYNDLTSSIVNPFSIYFNVKIKM